MSHDWRNLYFFVSSTFQDMHAERVYLTQRVYPELQVWCEQRNLNLVEVDLRWGITEEEAIENRNALLICLQRIDACRPFFVCFLGQRTGWIPRPDEVSEETYDEYPGLREVVRLGSSSITEIEVRHAASAPFDASPGTRRSAVMIFARDPGYLSSLHPYPELLSIYTDQRSSHDDERANRLDALMQEFVSTGDHTIQRYMASWSERNGLSTPELAIPLVCPSHRNSMASRWRERWRQACGIDVDGFEIVEGSEAGERAQAFNRRVTTGRLIDLRVASGEELAVVIRRELQKRIVQAYPEREQAEPNEDDLEHEIAQHERFQFLHAESSLARESDFDALDAYLASASRAPLFLTGVGGCGKSTLLASWTRRRTTVDRCLVLIRFVGASARASDIEGLLRSLLGELDQRHHRVHSPIPSDPLDLRKDFPRLLEEAGSHGETLIAIDGLDQLETGLHELAWIPVRLPPGIKLIATFREDVPKAIEVIERWTRAGCSMRTVAMFTAAETRRRFVVSQLWRNLKRMDTELLEELVSFPGAPNPLFLSIILSELQVIGSHDGLHAKIRGTYGETPKDAFSAVIARLESDSLPTTIPGGIAVPIIFGALAFSRHGLTEQELARLLTTSDAWKSGLGDDRDRIALDAIRLYVRQVRSFVTNREDCLDLFFETFREAAISYVSSPGAGGALRRPQSEWHRILAELFRSMAREHVPGTWDGASMRQLSEASFHLGRSGDMSALAKLYLDIEYLEAVILSAPKEVRRVDAIHPGLYQLTSNLQGALAFSRASRSDSVEILTKIERALSHSTPVLGKWNREQEPAFLARQLHADSILLQCPELTNAAEARLNMLGARPMKLRSSSTKLSSGPERRLVGHTQEVTAICVNSDATLALSASRDSTIRLWNLETGRTLAVLEGHDGEVTCLRPASDWTRVVSGSRDGTIRVWEPATGRLLRTFVAGEPVTAVAISADGSRAISGSSDGEIGIWDLHEWKALEVEDRHDSTVNALQIDATGRVALSGSGDTTLKLWDLQVGKLLSVMRGHEGAVLTIALSQDATRALSGSFDEEVNLRVWDTSSGKTIGAFRDHYGRVDAVQFVYGNSIALTSSLFSPYLSVWDLDAGVEIRTLSANGNVDAAWATSDGRTYVSLASGCLQTWNPTFTRATGEIVSGGRLLAIDERARKAVTSGGDLLDVWSLAPDYSTTYRSEADRHTDRINAIRFLPAGDRFVTASQDCTLRIWDLASSACVGRLQGHAYAVQAVAPTPDGHVVISGSGDRTVRAWDVKGCREIKRFEGHSRPDPAFREQGLWVGPQTDGNVDPALRAMQGGILDVALARGGTRVLSSSEDFTVKIWDFETERCLATYRGHRGSVRSVTVLTDDRRALSCAQEICLWDIDTLETLARFECSDRMTWARMVIASDRVLVSDGGSVCILELDGLSEVKRFDFDPWGRIAVAEHTAVLCGADVVILAPDTGDIVGRFEAHHPAACSLLAVTKSRRHVIASWVDTNALEIWNLETGRRTATLTLPHDVSTFRLSPDESSLVVGGREGAVSVVDVVGF